MSDHAAIVRETLGMREWAASITPSSYGAKVEAEIPPAFAALDALVAERDEALRKVDEMMEEDMSLAKRALAAEAERDNAREAHAISSGLREAAEARVAELEKALANWIEDVDDALSDEPGGHDAAVRIGSRWQKHDYAARAVLAPSATGGDS